MIFEHYTFFPQLCNKKELMGFAYVYKSKWHLNFLGSCGVLVQASHHFAINVYNENTTEIIPWKCDFQSCYCLQSKADPCHAVI